MKKLVILAALLLSACGAATNADSTDNANTTNTQNPTVGSAGADLTPGLEQPIAVFGEHSIPARDFLFVLRNEVNRQEWMLEQWMGFGPEDLAQYWQEINEETGYTTMESFRQNILDQVLAQGIVRILAYEASIGYDPVLLEEEIQSLQEQLDELAQEGMDGEAWLQIGWGITVDDYIAVQRNALVIPNFLEYLESGIEVTPEQVAAHVEEFPFLEQGQMARAVHILISTTDLETSMEIEYAYQIAQGILARINAGENPRDLAPIYSADPGSPDGFYEFPRGQMVEPFEEWAFAAQPGDTGIVETNFGFHVMYSEGQDSLEGVVINDLAMARLHEMLETSEVDWEVDYDFLDTIE